MEATTNTEGPTVNPEPAANGGGGRIEQTEDAARRLLLAGLGAFASACDVAADTFDQFVDRGQRVRDQWQSKADDVREQNRDARFRVRNYVRNAMDAVLETVDVPSKTDVDAIQLKLNVLNRKLDDLQMQSGREPFVPPEPPETPAGPNDAIT